MSRGSAQQAPRQRQMTAKRQSLTISQCFNPKHTAQQPKDEAENPMYVYQVEKAVNTLIEPISAWLTPARVKELMDRGIEVTIVPVK